MLAGHAEACSRNNSMRTSDRVVAEGTCSRGNATRHAPQADRSMMDIERRDWCYASIACRRGSLTRGQATVLQGGAALDLASCPHYQGHWSGRASMLGRSTRSAVVPTDATSMANSSDKRNPRGWAANFMPALHLASRCVVARSPQRDGRRAHRVTDVSRLPADPSPSSFPACPPPPLRTSAPRSTPP
jgi:hypothetical protein